MAQQRRIKKGPAKILERKPGRERQEEFARVMESSRIHLERSKQFREDYDARTRHPVKRVPKGPKRKPHPPTKRSPAP